MRAALPPFSAFYLMLAFLLPAWMGARAQVPLKFKHARITSLEQKQGDQPVKSLPERYVAATSVTEINLGQVWGYRVYLHGALLQVSAPSTIMASGGPGIQTANLAGSHVRLTATYVPQEVGEYLANCLVENQGYQGFYEVEDEESVKVPVSFNGQWNPGVVALFEEIDQPDEYYVPVTFATGSDGGFVRGTVELVYTTEEEPIRVDTLVDEDDGDHAEGDQSLREALGRAFAKENEPVAIPILVSGTIALDSELVATGVNAELVTILGNGDITLDGQGGCRILNVAAGRKVELMYVNVENGRSPVGELGGGIVNRGSLRLLRCLFKNNVARDSGGGAVATEGSQAVGVTRDCFFDGNRMIGDGEVGGTLVAINGASTSVVNCAIINSNMAVLNVAATATFLHCTLYNGRKLITTVSGGTTNLGHCAIAGGARGGNEPDIVTSQAGETVSLGFNAYESADSSFETVTSDIQADDLLMRSAAGGGVVLLAFSPCVDAGDPEVNTGGHIPPLTADIVGNPRESEEGKIDIGAIEVSAYTVYLARELTDNAPDKNQNGVPDIIDVLTGTLSMQGGAGAPQPLDFIDVLTGGPAALKAGVFPDSDAPPGMDHTIIEVRVDERVVDGDLTLETSTDLVTWTARATYAGQGPSFGYSRYFVDGATLVDERKAGFVYFLRESVPNDSGQKLFVRLRGTKF
jgi:hypothetical protein